MLSGASHVQIPTRGHGGSINSGISNSDVQFWGHTPEHADLAYDRPLYVSDLLGIKPCQGTYFPCKYLRPEYCARLNYMRN